MNKRIVKRVQFKERVVLSDRNGFKFTADPGTYSLELEEVNSPNKQNRGVRWVLLGTDFGLFSFVFRKMATEKSKTIKFLRLGFWDHLKNALWMIIKYPAPSSMPID